MPNPTEDEVFLITGLMGSEPWSNVAIADTRMEAMTLAQDKYPAVAISGALSLGEMQELCQKMQKARDGKLPGIIRSPE